MKSRRGPEEKNRGVHHTAIETKFVNAREELNFAGPNFDIEDYSFVNFAAEYEVNPHLSKGLFLRTGRASASIKNFGNSETNVR